MADAGVAKPAYEYPHLRQNPGLPNVAAKKREVSAIWHEEVVSGVSWHGWAQIVRAARLARRGDIVVLALHCHESGRPDRREIHWPTVGGQLAPPDGALLVDMANSVQEDFCGKVHQRRIGIEEGEPQGIVAIVMEHFPEELAAFADVAGQVGP